jgi:hypothetical protein
MGHTGTSQCIRQKMRGAMDRFVTVNASRVSNAPGNELAFNSLGPPSDDREDDFGIEIAPFPSSSPAGGNQGPCLYLGPRGERCGRPALANGFCARHQTGNQAISKPIAKPSPKLIAAVLAIIGMLWPLLADAVREVLRWIHTH